MSVVLNEYAWAENAVSNKSLGKKPYETLSRVAKYYTYQGLPRNDVRKKLDDFLVLCDPKASLVTWGEILDGAAKAASKYPIVMVDEVPVTKPEMEKIDALNGAQLQRLAFTLLYLAKFSTMIRPKRDHWVNTPDNEVMKMANINTSIKRQSILFRQLRDSGFIRFSKQIDNLSVQVLAVEDGESAIKITDFRNLGYQYMMFHGGPYYKWVRCGVTEKVKNPDKGRPPKYCQQCASEVRMEQSVNSVMRQRRIRREDFLCS